MNGIYENLITQLLREKLNNISTEYYIETTKIKSNEAALYLSRFL